MATLPTLTVCCVCKHVAATGSPTAQWMPMASFLERHHLRPTDVRVSHTYCPVCYEQQAAAWSIPAAKSSTPTPRAA